MGTSEKYHRQTPVLLSVRFSVCWFFSLFFFFGFDVVVPLLVVVV